MVSHPQFYSQFRKVFSLKKTRNDPSRVRAGERNVIWCDHSFSCGYFLVPTFTIFKVVLVITFCSPKLGWCGENYNVELWPRIILAIALGHRFSLLQQLQFLFWPEQTTCTISEVALSYIHMYSCVSRSRPQQHCSRLMFGTNHQKNLRNRKDFGEE